MRRLGKREPGGVLGGATKVSPGRKKRSRVHLAVFGKRRFAAGREHRPHPVELPHGRGGRSKEWGEGGRKPRKAHKKKEVCRAKSVSLLVADLKKKETKISARNQIDKTNNNKGEVPPVSGKKRVLKEGGGKKGRPREAAQHGETAMAGTASSPTSKKKKKKSLFSRRARVETVFNGGKKKLRREKKETTQEKRETRRTFAQRGAEKKKLKRKEEGCENSPAEKKKNTKEIACGACRVR